MANIKVSELRPAGSELFQDSESFLNDLTDMDTASVQGGEGTDLAPYLMYGEKFLEYGVVGYGISNIASLAKSFSVGADNGNGGNGNGGYSNGGAATITM